MSYVIFIIAGLVFAGALIVARRNEQRLETPFSIGLRGWQILRFLIFIPVVYALFVSGRTSFQAIGLVIVAIAAVYVALEQPFRSSA